MTTEKERYLALPTPSQCQSGTEWRNIVCEACSVCFEHANSAPHNNSVSCLCDSCRAAITECESDADVDNTVMRLWREADERGEVCSVYSYFAWIEEEKATREANNMPLLGTAEQSA